MAWWYRQYAKEWTLDDRKLYELAESEARAAKRGLWADNKPVILAGARQPTAHLPPVADIA